MMVDSTSASSGLITSRRSVSVSDGGDLQQRDQFADRGAFVGQFSKPAFDQVQPGGGRGGEVQVEPGMFVQPVPHGGMLVGGVVVADQVHVKPFGHLTVDGVEEAEELGVPVAGQALADDAAGQHI